MHEIHVMALRICVKQFIMREMDEFWFLWKMISFPINKNSLEILSFSIKRFVETKPRRLVELSFVTPKKGPICLILDKDVLII